MPSTPRPPSKSFSVAASSRPSSKNAPWPKKCRSCGRSSSTGRPRHPGRSPARRSPAGGRRPRRARRPRQWRSCGHAPASARRAGRGPIRPAVQSRRGRRACARSGSGPRRSARPRRPFLLRRPGPRQVYGPAPARPPAPGSGDGQSPSSALKPMVTPSAGARSWSTTALAFFKVNPASVHWRRVSPSLATSWWAPPRRAGSRGARQFAAHGLVDPAPALRQRIGACAVEGQHGVQAGRQRAEDRLLRQ